MDNMQPPITAPQQVPVQQYVYIATIQRYPVPQPPSISPELPQHLFPAVGQRHTPARLFYIWPLNMPRYAARQHHPHKAISEGPGVGETLLGCGMLLVAGILMLMLLYYLSAAR
jgi:hypothetical protein